ncbi:hypothetical protein NN3_63280 [Nocardia neocaledoniensis NBRC 108232]|uniref:Uncharacterized protein n=1 Tax=Nocardia neocaledoniensis TaxID=236511 RepID=A0A317NSN0_9NOCA|nr:hypothetical protein [Nocardia neocaledoniensis]PWV77883.1 hypothetical protein DFR69_103483 [Nocardia neocaledoniensis]GEM35321.1 hypothetical protein NN3_63280 [Nocardia neocaledoniensis NBRC 108232]
MTSTTGLLDRYQNYRVKRWLVQEQRTAGMLKSWRPQRRRRQLVVGVVVALAGLAVAGVLCAFDLRNVSITVAMIALVLFLPAWTMLRIASGGQDHAPAEMLDEFEIAERNKARSVGLALTQSLTMPGLFFLIFAGAFAPEADAYRTAYAGGLMLLAAIMTGGCAPAMIIGWTRPDPDPEP